MSLQKLLKISKTSEYGNELVNKTHNKMDKLLVDSIVNYVKRKPEIFEHYNFTYKSQKYKLDHILYEIVDIIKYGKSYRSSQKIPKSTLFDHRNKLCAFGILKNTYRELLRIYINKSPTNKLEKRYTDTSFVVNKLGQEKIGYSGKHKRIGTKISLETISDGLPIKIKIDSGNIHDSQIYLSQLTDEYLISKTVIDKYKRYLIADPAYDTKNIKQAIIDDGCIPIIKYNKRGTVDKKIIQKNSFNDEQLAIYSSRLKIEHFNGLLKTCKRCQTRYDRTEKHFLDSIYFSCIERVLKLL
jgi:hypothetical protein